MAMRLFWFLALCSLSVAPLCAQDAANPVKIGDVVVNGSVRTRSETWSWFKTGSNSAYTFSETIFRIGLSQNKKTFDWKIDFVAPVLLGLPSDQARAAPQGQLGFGGSYYAANSSSNNVGLIFPKQAYFRLKFGDSIKQSLLFGRNEFVDGGEVIPKNATLRVIKRDRIAQRLIGTFTFSDVGRSFDGAVYSLNAGPTNITLFGARPTRGVFQVDGWGEVSTNIFYGAINRQIGSAENSGELRVFAIGYNDFRNVILKTDNRPVALRTADLGGIDIATLGAHYIQTFKTSAGDLDLLFWGAIQGGSWGNLKQRADAYALEGGWQIPRLEKLKPWLRGGYNYGSGDKNPTDGTHGTFFLMLPTPRPYARFPFFNMMNNRDAFGELTLQPTKSVTLRADVHALSLASKKDLWYSGGGAFQPWTFGFTGRPSNNLASLANLYDISVDYTVNSRFAVAAYYGYVAGKSVIQRIYPTDQMAALGYLELNYRF
jgi:hypothetical protein